MTPNAPDTSILESTKSPAVAPPYFPVARHKLVIMSLATLSTYQLYWFYRNFALISARGIGGGGSAFWRAFFAPLTAHSLFAQVRLDARSRFIAVPWSAGGLAAIFFLVTISCFMPYPWLLLAFGSVFVLLPVHATAEAVNAKEAPNAPRNDGYSMWNVLAIVLGIAVTIAGVIALREVDQLFQQLENQL
ncbi:MAG: hypothetical protein ACREMU_11755 [Gemmatimonadaceae bacterium]